MFHWKRAFCKTCKTSQICPANRWKSSHGRSLVISNR